MKRNQCKIHTVMWALALAPISVMAASIENTILAANESILLRDFARAEEQLAIALSLAESEQVRDHRRAAIFGNLGYVYHHTGRPVRAEQFERQAADLYRELGLTEGEATSQANLGRIVQDGGHYLEAEKHYLRSISLWEKARGEKSPQLAAPLSELGSLYEAQRKFTKSERMFRRALEIQRNSLPRGDPGIARTLNNIGTVRQAVHDFDEAERLYRDALETVRAAKLSDPDLEATSLHNLASIYAEKEEPSRAEAVLREALSLWRATLGEKHPAYGKGLANLGIVYYQVGRVAQAADLLGEAASITEAVYGPTHPEVGRVLTSYAVVLKKMKRKREAKLVRQRAQAILGRHADDNLLNATIHVSDLATFQ